MLPGCSVIGGVRGKDWFDNPNDVVQYCRQHNFYAKYLRDQEEFYRFPRLWRHVLVRKGWHCVEAPKSFRDRGLGNMWYALPGFNSTNGKLGLQCFKDTADVVKYCKARKYFAKYGLGIKDAGGKVNPTQHRSRIHDEQEGLSQADDAGGKQGAGNSDLCREKEG